MIKQIHEYVADIDNVLVGIQPDMMKMYAGAGYKIYRIDYVEVTDIDEELENITPNEESGSTKEAQDG